MVLQKMERLHIHYADDFDTFMNSVLAVSISTGLPGADAIHYVSAISIPDVDEIVTLDRHFKKVKDQVEVNILGKK
jgi:predicted nucleic acid-binding protein